MPEPHARAELDQPRGLGRSPPPRADPEPLGGAPQQRHVAHRLGRRRSAAAAACRREAPRPRAGSPARCGSPAAARRAARTRPRAPPAVKPARQLEQRERVAARLGEDPVAHARVERPGHRPRPAARGRRRRGSPSTRSSGSPVELVLAVGLAHARTPTPTRSANSRRATNASVCADTRSSHCASSTMHTSGCSSAASASRLSTASPTRKRSGGGPALRPNAVLQRVALRPRQPPSASSIGAHSACRPANASSISDSTPAARTTRHPSAAADR